MDTTASLAKDTRARMGMWVFLGSEIMFFGPVFFGYLYGRHTFPAAFAAASRSTDLLCGTLNTAILLTSSLLIACAVEKAEHIQSNKGPVSETVSSRPESLGTVRRLLDATVLLGLLFLAVKGYEYAQDWSEGLVPGAAFHLAAPAAEQAGAQLFYFVYFFSTLLHALHLIIGMGLVMVCRRQLMQRPGPRAHRRLDAIALYWHFVDIIWIFLFPALYLGGRSV